MSAAASNAAPSTIVSASFAAISCGKPSSTPPLRKRINEAVNKCRARPGERSYRIHLRLVAQPDGGAKRCQYALHIASLSHHPSWFGKQTKRRFADRSGEIGHKPDDSAMREIARQRSGLDPANIETTNAFGASRPAMSGASDASICGLIPRRTISNCRSSSCRRTMNTDTPSGKSVATRINDG